MEDIILEFAIFAFNVQYFSKFENLFLFFLRKIFRIYISIKSKIYRDNICFVTEAKVKTSFEQLGHYLNSSNSAYKQNLLNFMIICKCKDFYLLLILTSFTI